MLCKFCVKEKQRLCEAHIIPRAFHKYMYPDERIGGKPLVILHGDNNNKGRSWSGLYDKTILCAECDNILGKLDEVGVDALLYKPLRLVKTFNHIEAFVLENVDVLKLKLFFLSVLWRASISQLQEFNSTNLGKKFEMALHHALLANDPGGQDDFSIVLTKFGYTSPEKGYHKFLELPHKVRMDGLNYYCLYFPNGFKAYIKMDSRPQAIELRSLTLTNDEPVYIFQFEHFEDSENYKRVQQQVSKILNISNNPLKRKN